MDGSDANKHEERERAAIEKAFDDALECLRGRCAGLVIIGSWTLENGETAAMMRVDGDWYCQNGLVEYFRQKRRMVAKLEAKDQHDADGP